MPSIPEKSASILKASVIPIASSASLTLNWESYSNFGIDRVTLADFSELTSYHYSAPDLSAITHLRCFVSGTRKGNHFSVGFGESAFSENLDPVYITSSQKGKLIEHVYPIFTITPTARDAVKHIGIRVTDTDHVNTIIIDPLDGYDEDGVRLQAKLLTGFENILTERDSMISQSQEFLTSGTLIVPDKVTSMIFEGIGNGGAGAGGQSGGAAGGGGGGSGEKVVKELTVAPGSTLTITIPAAASGGAAQANGADGGNVTVSVSGVTIFTARGGKGGTYVADTGGLGGAGGGNLGASSPTTDANGSMGTIGLTHVGGSSGGSSGANGGATEEYSGGTGGHSAIGGGGGGAAGHKGNGGNGGARTSGTAGTSAAANSGAGGGGGGNSNLGTGGAGGNGGTGYLRISWVGP